MCYSLLVVPWASSGCHHCSIKDEDLSRSLTTTNRNMKTLHSPSISYSSYISGSRWSTCFYHSCRHSDTSGSHHSPEKRSISKHRIRNPQHSCASSRPPADTAQHVTDGELTSMQGLMSWFRTFRAFWSIWICMDGKKQASFSQKHLPLLFVTPGSILTWTHRLDRKYGHEQCHVPHWLIMWLFPVSSL